MEKMIGDAIREQFEVLKRPDLQELTNEELIDVIHKKGDSEAHLVLIQKNLCFLQYCIIYESQIWKNVYADEDDLMMAAIEGFSRAAISYRPSNEASFLTYSWKFVRGHIRKEMNGPIWNKDVTETYPFEKREEVEGSDETDETEMQSIECEVDGWGYASELYSLSPEQIFFQQWNKENLYAHIEKLEERKRVYLSYRFGLYERDRHTREETAIYWNISYSRAKEIEVSALSELRHMYSEEAQVYKSSKT